MMFMKVKDLMKTNLKVIDSNDNLRNAIKIMKKYNISRLLVKKNGKIVGILSERDISDRLGRLETTPLSDAHVHVSSAYVDKLITINENADLKLAAKMMLENKISSLVVTNDSNEIVGIITKSDLINVLENSSIPVSKYASKKIINLKVGSSLLHARRLMLDNNVKRVLITFDSEVVGIITESDIANFLGMFRKVSEGVQWYNKLKTINVEDIMSRDVVVINENSTLGDAVKLMKKNNISGLPVVNNQNKLAGIITKTDLIRAIVDLY